MTIIRAAIVQDAPVAFDREQTLCKVEARMREAASRGAQLVVSPEAFLSGYPKGIDFGARVGMRAPEGRDEFVRYWNSAVPIPSPTTEALAALAREHQLYLVIGVIEQDGGTLSCTALFFSPEGTPLGKHRKTI